MKTDKLEKLNACNEAIEYVKTQESALSAWQNCERGDWMLWIAKRLNVDDKKLTLAKVMCAKQVEHLMKDQRSKDALVACLRYVNGEITREELNVAAAAAAYADAAAAYAYADADAAAAYAYAAAADAAAYAYADADAAAAYAAAAAAAAAYAAAAVYAYADAAAAAADADADAADADVAAAAAYAYADADAAARINSLKKSSDICREYLTEEVLNAYNKLKK
jgi:hypothetical protein